MSRDKAKGRADKKIVFACAAILLILVSGLLICRYLILKPIPELKRLAELNASRSETAFLSYDGDKVSYCSFNANSKEEAVKELNALQRLYGTKGIKVTGWTADKLKYPVYSVTIRPAIYKSEKYEPGETFVWSNGYLITSGGDVYRCRPNLKPFMKSDENDYTYELSGKSISEIRYLRPLAMANNKWNKEMLQLSSKGREKKAANIDVTVNEIKTGDAKTVKVSIKNNDEDIWRYSDRPLYIVLEVKLDGEWFSIYHDPNVDDVFPAAYTCDKVLEAGQNVDVDYSLGFYGKLPPGEYRILISGQSGDRADYADACFQLP